MVINVARKRSDKDPGTGEVDKVTQPVFGSAKQEKLGEIAAIEI